MRWGRLLMTTFFSYIWNAPNGCGFPWLLGDTRGRQALPDCFEKTKNGLLLKNVVQIEKKLLHSKGKSAILCIESS